MLSVWRLCAGPDSEHRRSEHLEMFAGVFRTGEADGVIADTRSAAKSSLIFTYIYSGTFKTQLCGEIGRLISQPGRARDCKTAWHSAVIQKASK